MPIISGKKCPRCRTDNHAPLPEQPWFFRLPGLAHLICADCGQDFYFLAGVSILHERRATKRLHPPHTLLVRFGDTEQQFARIQDISSEGIGFSYRLGSQKLHCARYRIDLFNCKQGTFLKDLPVQIVSSEVLIQNAAGRLTTIMKIGARFIDLNPTQKKLLSHFIKESGRNNLPQADQADDQG